jgi:hypothetical protein
VNGHVKSLTIFIITSPSDGLFCFTDGSFYAESNGETGIAVVNGSYFHCMIDLGNVSMVDGFVDPLPRW